MLPIPPETEALIFDCDGTLIDSMPIHIECWQAALLDRGVQLPASYIDQRAGMPTDVIVREMSVDFGVELDPAAVTDDKESRYLARLGEVQPIHSVLATAQHYQSKMPMAVASGGERSIVVQSLAAVSALELFGVMVTADDPVAAKPSPAIFLEAARQLKIDATRCHVFEDADHGITAAREAGMTWTDVRQLS